MSGCHPGIVTPHSCGFSSGRTQKLPSTPRSGLFAVRHRLRRDSLASASCFAPLVVELFPAAFCRAVPGLVVVRSVSSPRAEVPTPAALCGRLSPHPAGGIFTRFDPPRPSVRKACPCRPRSGVSSIGSNARVVFRVVTRRFGRASLRRTGRAPLDASGSTGWHGVGGSRGG
jgi:hypothetical protein